MRRPPSCANLRLMSQSPIVSIMTEVSSVEAWGGELVANWKLAERIVAVTVGTFTSSLYCLSTQNPFGDETAGVRYWIALSAAIASPVPYEKYSPRPPMDSSKLEHK